MKTSRHILAILLLPGVVTVVVPLLVRGVYRRVRTPMLSGVFFVLVGEAALLGSPPVLVWFLIAFAVYISLIEEPSLSYRFGDEYLDYKRNVPCWIPRLKPWTPGSGARS